MLDALKPALFLLVPAFAFLAMQLIKAVSAKIDGLPALGKQVIVTVIAFASSVLASKTGIPIPADLLGYDQAVIEQVIGWVLTAVVGGGGAMALHVAKKVVE